MFPAVVADAAKAPVPPVIEITTLSAGAAPVEEL
jgi:hypothetical protein